MPHASADCPRDTVTTHGGFFVKFISTRIITADVNRLVDFYEMVTEVPAVWGNELFAEIPTPAGTLAIGSDKTVPLFGAGSAEPAANRSAILEFIVEDVDAEYQRLRQRVGEVVTEPTTMPWGNRALLFRDPDGNLVNLFTPVTDEARAKFGI
jgi:predicted enzyme related to lactoylglutathione lyase